ncbi:MAG: hypothetical protein IIA87_02005 [Nanoarchaeota archaeon]|nr:hypothetical protein [Nanoarchaeota archaeon]
MEKIKANLIIEIMGRPPEHISEALNTLVIKMGSEEGVEIKDKKYHKPVAVKDAKNLYITFAEVEAEFDSLENYFGIIFTYMPSNVEIISHDKIKLNIHELNSLGNSILSKLHHYDAIAKGLVAERDILVRQLKSLGVEKQIPKINDEVMKKKTVGKKKLSRKKSVKKK